MKRLPLLLLALVPTLLIGCQGHTQEAKHANAPLDGPPLGSPAPDGEVVTLQGEHIRLGSRLGSGPTVLLVGNFTCPGFQGTVDPFKVLATHYGSRASFLLLYIRESHPTEAGGQADVLNKSAGICLSQPRSTEERVENAKTFVRKTRWEIPTLVAPIDDALANQYNPGSPMCLYILEGGVIRYKSAVGVVDLEEANQWLGARFPDLPRPPPFAHPLHPPDPVVPRETETSQPPQP